MVDMMNWFLSFFAEGFETLFSLTSSDGYSLGWMALSIAIIGTVITATIGAVGLVSNQIKDNSYARSADQARAARFKKEG